jgi:hypothetical protein
MSEIKSAYERAMERIQGIGEPTKEEVLEWKFVPEGQRLAARYLKEDLGLAAELAKFKDEERPFVIKGAQDIFLRNITLPLNEIAKKTNKKVMDAIKQMKRDKTSLENTYTKMRRIFDHFSQEGEQQRKQAYEMLKQDFQMRIQQALQQQGLPQTTRVNVEAQPQFQEEWRRAQASLDSQYTTLLDEYKAEIERIR